MKAPRYEAAAQRNIEEQASWLSYALMWYANPVLRLGASRRLEERDRVALAAVDDPARVRAAFEAHWRRLGASASLRATLWAQFRRRLIAGFVGSIFFVLLTIAAPLTIRALVAHVARGRAATSRRAYVGRGLGLVAALTAIQLVDAVVRAHTMYHVKRVGIAWQSAMMGAIFRRCLALRGGAATGRLVALASTDSSRWPDSMPALLNAVLLPFWLAFILCAVAVWVGVAEALAGVVAACALVLPVKRCGDAMRRAQKAKSEAADARLKRSRELVSGIRAAKLMGWEASFVDEIRGTRAVEERRLRDFWMNFSAATAISSLAAVASLLASTARRPVAGGRCLADTFLAVSLYKILAGHVMEAANSAATIAQLRVAFKRFDDFAALPAEDVVAPPTPPPPGADADVLAAVSGDFGWDDHAVLRGCDVALRRGSLTVVCGAVGAGKRPSSGARRCGRTSRSSPRAPSTTRGSPRPSPRRFPDLDIWPAGLETEVGARGITISGGQKARIAVARAHYAAADLSVYDDPLSAVDVHVARKLWEAIVGAPGARLVATQQVHLLDDRVDEILFLVGGRVAERGPLADLLAKNGGFAKLYRSSRDAPRSPHAEERKEADAPPPPPEKKKDPGAPAPSGVLVREERRHRGAVRASAFAASSPTAARRPWAPPPSRSSSSSSRWTGSRSGTSAAGRAGGPRRAAPRSSAARSRPTASSRRRSPLAIAARGVAWTLFACTASSSLHERAVRRVSRAPLSWFDATPVGRVLSRLAQDVDDCDFQRDFQLPKALDKALLLTLQCASGVLLAIFASPWFALAVPPIFYCFYATNQAFRQVSRETQRLKTTALAPCLSALEQSLGGLGTIRAFAAADRLDDAFLDSLGALTSWCWLKLLLDQWLLIRLTSLSSLIVSAFALAVVLGDVDPVLAGLALSQTVLLTQDSRFAVRFATLAEAKLNAVDRLLDYGDDLPQERGAVGARDGDLPARGGGWPAAALECVALRVRYRVDLNPALDGVSFAVPAGAFLGVCGRTGSGKSTLGLALFRLAEAEGGRVLLGGVDVATVGLDALRARLAAVPQDPQLFEGTLRSNVDPFGRFDDDAVAAALRKARCAFFDGDLDARVSEGGANLSCGERQLLCFARVLLRSACVVLLDEATSSIDADADAQVQAVIRAEIRGRSTMVVIAHRIKTIRHADLVLVLGDGRVAEFGARGPRGRGRPLRLALRVVGAGVACFYIVAF
ncbi:ATPase [Aureococcus anophagefferens]|nr:ATPase [Aureococcus anophagefferens]